MSLTLEILINIGHGQLSTMHVSHLQSGIKVGTLNLQGAHLFLDHLPDNSCHFITCSVVSTRIRICRLISISEALDIPYNTQKYDEDNSSKQGPDRESVYQNYKS